MNTNILFTNNIYNIRQLFRDFAANTCAYVKYNESTFEYPRLISLDDFSLLIENYIRVNPEQDHANIYFKNYSEKELKRIEEKYEKVKNIIESIPHVYDESFRFQLIKNQNINKKTAYDYIQKIWKNGGIKFALRSKYDNCGKDRSIENYIGIPGAKSNYKKVQILISEEDKARIIKVYNSYIKNRKGKKIKSTFSKKRIYDQLIDKFYLGKGDEKPTENQFYYWFNKLVPKKKLFLDLDPNDFNRNNRFLTGSSADEVQGPGYLYHMDATKLGIYLCSSIVPDQYIGKAVLFLIIDVFSHYIVGYYLGLENESYGTGNLALLNAFSDKTPITDRFDSTRGEKWPAANIPVKLTADKGAHYSKYADALTQHLGIQVTNTAAYRPDLKGLVESTINVIQTKCYEKVAFTGVSVSLAKSHPRLIDDPRKNAFIPFNLCEEIAVRTILTYNDSVMRSFPKTDELRIDKVKSIPKDIWNHYIQNGFSCGRYIPENHVRKFLLYNKMVSYSRLGIKVAGEYFIPADKSITKILENKYFNNSQKKIELFYNPSDFTEIFILLDDQFHSLVPRNKIQRTIYNFYEFFKSFVQHNIDYKKHKNDSYDIQSVTNKKLNDKVTAEMEKRKDMKIKTSNVTAAKNNEKGQSQKPIDKNKKDSNDNDIIKQSAQ